MLLGLRLAVGTGGQRARTVATGTAAAVAVVVVLVVWDVAEGEVGRTAAFGRGQVSLLVGGTVAMVALPALVLVATMARLSAGVRDRRLAALRLLGLGAGGTRLVAATETGLAGLLGALLGSAVATGVLPLVPRVTSWHTGALEPPPLVVAGVVLAVVAVGVATASLPPRLSSRRAVGGARREGERSASLLRAVPLLAGFVVCWATRSPLVDQSSTLPLTEVAAILVGILLLGVGMLLVVPVFTSMVAVVVLRLGRGPGATLLGRRLQSQPAGATRVVAALMVGLFVVVAARGVVGTFMATPQYQSAADFVEHDQTAEVTAHAGRAAVTGEALRSLPGVRRVESYRVLRGATPRSTPGSAAQEPDRMTVIVATCEQLAGSAGSLPGCSDRGASVVDEPFFFHPGADTIRVRSDTGTHGRGPAVSVPVAGATTIDPEAFARAVGGALEGTPAVVVPPSTSGVAALLPHTDRLVVAHAGPGRFLYDRVQAAGFRIDSRVDLDTYDFVQGMLALVWLLAGVVLSIGLLTFTVAGIDRALGRRRELTALRLVGTPGGLLRRTQWAEAALPSVAGSLLAIAAGGYAGTTYLQLDDDMTMPMTATLALAAAAVAASVLLAWLTTLGTTAGLDPEHIRAE